MKKLLMALLIGGFGLISLMPASKGVQGVWQLETSRYFKDGVEWMSVSHDSVVYIFSSDSVYINSYLEACDSTKKEAFGVQYYLDSLSFGVVPSAYRYSMLKGKEQEMMLEQTVGSERFELLFSKVK